MQCESRVLMIRLDVIIIVMYKLSTFWPFI